MGVCVFLKHILATERKKEGTGKEIPVCRLAAAARFWRRRSSQIDMQGRPAGMAIAICIGSPPTKRSEAKRSEIAGTLRAVASHTTLPPLLFEAVKGSSTRQEVLPSSIRSASHRWRTVSSLDDDPQRISHRISTPDHRSTRQISTRSRSPRIP